jgi:hypothetical protein
MRNLFTVQITGSRSVHYQETGIQNCISKQERKTDFPNL